MTSESADKSELAADATQRIAPSAPRGNEPEGASVSGSASADGVSAPSPKRNRAAIAGIVAACAIVLCVAVAGVGYAAGWFGGSEAPAATATQGEKEAGAQKADATDTADAADAKDAESSDAATQAEETAVDASSAASDTASAPAETSTAPAVEPSQPDPTPAPAPEPEPVQPSTITVSVYIDSSRASSSGYPSCMASTQVTLSPGASVYNALCATGVSVGGSSSYVSSINGLAEFSCGSGSGWLYLVNGSRPGYGCGSYILNGGESITWVYSLDFGNDV